MIRALSRAALFAFAAVIALAVGAVAVCPEKACRTPWFDTAGLVVAHESRHAWLDSAFMALTGLGSLFVLVPAVAWFAWRSSARKRVDAVFVGAALAGAVLMAHAAKWLIARPRPDLFPALVEMPPDASFPSAHTIQITAVVAACLLRPGHTPAASEVVAGGMLIAAVSLSRIYLQVHFPSDVMVGVVSALAWVMALRCLPVWKGGLR